MKVTFQKITTQGVSAVRKVIAAGAIAATVLGSALGSDRVAEAQSIREDIQSKYSISCIADRIVGYQEKIFSIKSYQSKDDLVRDLFAKSSTETPDKTEPMVNQPGVNAPPTETTKPVEEAPAPAETPQVETPRTETPQAEAPQAETPRVETPQTETPETETPQAEAPQVETPKTNETPDPVETPKTEETPDQVETPKTNETPSPVETPKTEEAPAPVETPTPAETAKPVETPKPAETPQVETPEPAETTKPAEASDHVEDPTSAETAKPVETPKTNETPAPVETPKPVETAKPVEPAKPVEATKPAEPAKPVETPKPAESAKPVETPKPAESAKPVEPAKPVETPKPQVVRHVTYVSDSGKTLTVNIDGQTLPETVMIDGVEMIVIDRHVDAGDHDITRGVIERYGSKEYSQPWQTEIRVDGKTSKTVNTNITYRVRFDKLTQKEDPHPTNDQLFGSVLNKIKSDYDIAADAKITHDGQSIKIEWSTKTTPAHVEKVTSTSEMKTIIKAYSDSMPALNSNDYNAETVNELMTRPNGENIINERLNAQFVKRANELRAKLGLSEVSIDSSFNARHAGHLKSHLSESFDARDHVMSSGKMAMFDEVSLMQESMVPTSTIKTLHDVTPEALADYAFKMFISEWKVLGSNDARDGHLRQIILDSDGLKWIGGTHIESMTHSAGRGILSNVNMSVYNLTIVMIEYK